MLKVTLAPSSCLSIPLEVLGELVGDSGFVRRCHDGVDVYSATHSPAALLEIASAVTRFKLTVKPYAPWQPLAQTLFPNEHWDMISSVPVSAYLQVLTKAHECGDVGVEYNRHSLVYRELVEACLYGHVVRVGGELEYFDGGLWKETNDLPYTVQQVLNSIFATVKRINDDGGRNGVGVAIANGIPKCHFTPFGSHFKSLWTSAKSLCLK